MKLIDGVFKYGETVAVEIDGNLMRRKVHYADGELYINIDGRKVYEKDLTGQQKFDSSAYMIEYIRQKRDKISVLAPKGTKDSWKKYAADLGMSMNAFIIYCVEKEIHG